MKTELRDFDMANYLDSEEVIAEYISQILEDGNTDELLEAFSHIARAKGMSKVAKKANVGRESLYKTLKKGTKPRFDTILKLIDSFGLKLQVMPK